MSCMVGGDDSANSTRLTIDGNSTRLTIDSTMSEDSLNVPKASKGLLSVRFPLENSYSTT